jgi:F420-dependent oxidoreductase-like protein
MSAVPQMSRNFELCETESGLTPFRVFAEPQQGAGYDDLLAVALRAERLGFGAFFRSDHFLKMGSVSGLPGPSDAWITLAGLARDTTRIRLGTLVTAATFRHPGPLAIAVANVDDMSGGRVELGIGAGWFEAEHTAYGIPFPTLGERFDRLSEQLDVITGLWGTPDGATFDYSGEHYRLSNSPALPKPRQASGPPIVIGGRGARRTPALTAAHATEFNMPFCDLETFTAQVANVRRACEAIGRDPSTLRVSCALVVCVGEDESTFARRASAIGREPDELRANGVAGTPSQAAAVVDRWRAAGAERIYLQVLDLSDLDHLDLIASEVLEG